MRIKMVIPIIGVIMLGYLFGNVIFKGYEKNTLDAFGEQKNVFFLQQGVYSSLESLEENTKNIKNYVYIKEGEFYRTYVALSKDYDNAHKLKELFTELGNDIYIRELSIKNKEFLDILEQYDSLISVTHDNENLLIIAREILIKYKELVVDSEASIN